MRSDQLVIGDFIQLQGPELGGWRRCEVVNQLDDGFVVKYFTPDGQGPFFCLLPHGTLPDTLGKVEYEHERAGLHSGYMNWHGDYTGRENTTEEKLAIREGVTSLRDKLDFLRRSCGA